MKEKPKNPPAFPTLIGDRPHAGMTLRDYYAGQAMQGLMTMEDKGTHKSMEDCYARIAELSYGMADAMLNQRQK